MELKKTFEFISSSPEETEVLGAKLALAVGKGAFVAFYGDLGAGKTAFVRGMGKAICPNAEVCSPTYSVINEYRDNGKTVLCHVDAYRISDDDDLYSTGFYDYLDRPDCTVAVEWCEKIPFAVPDDAVKVTIERIGDTERRITVEGSQIEI